MQRYYNPQWREKTERFERIPSSLRMRNHHAHEHTIQRVLNDVPFYPSIFSNPQGNYMTIQ